MKSPQIGPLSTLGGHSGWISGQMDDDTERQRDRQRDRKQCRKRDESVDKVKLEIRLTDGGEKNVTCQVACGTPGRDRQILTVGR